MYELPEVIERASTKNGEIQLQKRNEDYEIIFNGTFLMATYNGNSEQLLVSSAIKATPFPKKILIGGLGVGFSLGEALRHKGIENVTVVEIEPKIIEWNKKYLAKFSNNGLEDSRVKIINDDLIEWMFKTKEQYDVICLDIDNGPHWTVFSHNSRLYSCEGLGRLTELLNTNGAISFWSASKSPVFERRLRSFFKNINVYPVTLDGKKPDYVYVAFERDFIQ
jgi:spermidine synthase